MAEISNDEIQETSVNNPETENLTGAGTGANVETPKDEVKVNKFKAFCEKVKNWSAESAFKIKDKVVTKGSITLISGIGAAVVAAGVGLGVGIPKAKKKKASKR